MAEKIVELQKEIRTITRKIAIIESGIDRWAEGNINLMNKVDKIYGSLIDDDTFKHIGLITKVERLWRYNEDVKETCVRTKEMWQTYNEIKMGLKWSKLIVGTIGVSGVASILNIVLQIIQKLP